MLTRFMPMLRFLSQRNLSKPSALRVTDTRDTWELSMACSEIKIKHFLKKTKSYLKLNASVSAVPGGLIQEILQRLQHLLQKVSLYKPGLKHSAAEFCNQTSIATLWNFM